MFKIRGVRQLVKYEARDYPPPHESGFVHIEKTFRLQKFDKIQNKKTDTESLIIVFESEIDFPSHLYLGYRRLTVKEFIPHPIRCFKCQKFGHISKNCRGKQKCPLCSEDHTFEECQNRENKINA